MTAPQDCKYAPRHVAAVVYKRRARDWFRKSYWLVCFECDLRRGPFWDVTRANAQRRLLDTA